MVEAFERYAGIDLMSVLPPEGPDRRRFATMALDIGVHVPQEDTWGDVFSRVLVEKIEPHLGNGRATILNEYPSVMSALARPTASDPRLAERFEIYICGVELANGFGELTDAGRAAPPACRRDGGEGAHLSRALSDRRRLHRGAARDAAGLRRGARLRPAGDAGDRRDADRPGDVGAGRRAVAHRRKHGRD